MVVLYNLANCCITLLNCLYCFDDISLILLTNCFIILLCHVFVLNVNQLLRSYGDETMA